MAAYRSLTRKDTGVERYTFDTNIFFYSIDVSEPEKHRLARQLIALAHPLRVPIPLQVLSELCNSISKRRPHLLGRAQATVDAARRFFDIVPADVDDIPEALFAHQEHGLPFWDAMLWATARRADCSLLLTEDLQDGRILGGVTFRNPFHMTRDELSQLLT